MLFLRPSLARAMKLTSVRNFAQNRSGLVLFEEPNNAGLIIINRPKALNAINLEIVSEIYNQLRAWEDTKNVVVIRSCSPKAFCAGGDVRRIVEDGPSEDTKNFFRNEYRTNALIGRYKKPYVALIDGITMGGGVGLSVHGRYRIATENTLFAMPETAIGLFPDVGGGYFLPRLQGKLGYFLGLTGFRLRGADVVKAGIATHLVDSVRLSELEKTLLEVKHPEEVEGVVKKFATADGAPFILEKNLKSIDEYFSAPTVEEIIERLKHDGSEWAANALKSLAKFSPLSLKVTKRQLDLGAKLSLEDCLKMEFRMAVHHATKSDFKEGVRALLIDKDQSPKWNPDRLEKVSEEQVNSYFGPLPDGDELVFE